jgi:hypothetical protein
MKKLLKLTDTQKLQIIKNNDKENDIIEKVSELLQELENCLDAKDIECEIDENITSLIEKLDYKVCRNYLESRRLSKELIK